MIKLCKEILQKAVAEIKYYTFDFSNDLETGETLSSISVSATPTGLTLGTPVVSGSNGQVKISSGVAGTTYTVICAVTTSTTETLEASGYLIVDTH